MHMWLPSEICGGRTERSETPCCHQETLEQDKIETNKLRTRRLGNTDFSFILYHVFSRTLSLLKKTVSNIWYTFSQLTLATCWWIFTRRGHNIVTNHAHLCDLTLTPIWPLSFLFFLLLFVYLCCTLKNLFSSLLILPHEMASPVVLNVLKPSGLSGPLDPRPRWARATLATLTSLRKGGFFSKL